MSEPLGNFTPQQIVDETSNDPDVIASDEAQQLACCADASEEGATLNFNNGKMDYLRSNLEAPLTPIVSASKFRAGVANASIAGTLNLFSSPIDTTLDDNGLPKYSLILDDDTIEYVSPEGVDTRTLNGFTAFAKEDNRISGYQAAVYI